MEVLSQVDSVLGGFANYIMGQLHGEVMRAGQQVTQTQHDLWPVTANQNILQTHSHCPVYKAPQGLQTVLILNPSRVIHPEHHLILQALADHPDPVDHVPPRATILIVAANPPTPIGLQVLPVEPVEIVQLDILRQPWDEWGVWEFSEPG